MYIQWRKSMKRESFRKGMKDGVPIALGYFAVSFTFGMMAVAGGLRIWQAVLISLTNLTSAGQFAGLDIIFAGGSMLSLIHIFQAILRRTYSFGNPGNVLEHKGAVLNLSRATLTWNGEETRCV